MIGIVPADILASESCIVAERIFGFAAVGHEVRQHFICSSRSIIERFILTIISKEIGEEELWKFSMICRNDLMDFILLKTIYRYNLHGVQRFKHVQ